MTKQKQANLLRRIKWNMTLTWIFRHLKLSSAALHFSWLFHLDWSPPAVNSTDWTWKGTHTCLHQVSQLTMHIAVCTPNQVYAIYNNDNARTFHFCRHIWFCNIFYLRTGIYCIGYEKWIIQQNIYLLVPVCAIFENQNDKNTVYIWG